MRKQKVARPDDVRAQLRAMYGDLSARFPPSSVVCFVGDELHEHVVVGYGQVEGVDTVSLVDVVYWHVGVERYAELAVPVPPARLAELVILYNICGRRFAESWSVA